LAGCTSSLTTMGADDVIMTRSLQGTRYLAGSFFLYVHHAAVGRSSLLMIFLFIEIYIYLTYQRIFVFGKCRIGISYSRIGCNLGNL
jgi:hypothetical protein